MAPLCTIRSTPCNSDIYTTFTHAGSSIRHYLRNAIEITSPSSFAYRHSSAMQQQLRSPAMRTVWIQATIALPPACGLAALYDLAAVTLGT